MRGQVFRIIDNGFVDSIATFLVKPLAQIESAKFFEVLHGHAPSRVCVRFNRFNTAAIAQA